MGNRLPKSILLAAAFAVLACAAWAQGSAKAPKALLVFADNPDAAQIIDASGVGRPAGIGDEIAAGELLKTGATSAELQLDPNGSIIKVSRNTSFKIEGLSRASPDADTNRFALLAGKVRTVAAKGDKYRIRTPSAVCGVRGTDFSLSAEEGVRDSVMVKRGLVDFAKVAADGTETTIQVGAGQFADAFAAAFAASAFTQAQFAVEYGDAEFAKLNPADVKEAEAVPSGKAAPAPSADTVPAPASPPPPKADVSGAKAASWLGEMLGLEIGSVVIDGKTYSKAVIQPTFKTGKLKMSLYLPVIYTSDVFNPDDWYHPKGNNEWSFGSEHWGKDNKKAAADAARDLALKIRYIEYGDQAFDPTYFKIGNLNSMTLGHGSLVRNFANDADFPAVRRVGFNAGSDHGFWGAEALVDDLVEPSVVGGRVKLFYVFGFSAVADTNPFPDLDKSQRDSLGDPMLLGGAADVDLPIIKGDKVALKAFADAAAMAPYNRTSVVGGKSAGLQTKVVYDADAGSGVDAVRNYGLLGGFMGKFLILNWRLEYRQYRGIFQPGIFNAGYERNKTTYAQAFYDMADDPTAYDFATVRGIYGEAGFSLLRDHISFTGGYMLPWSDDSNATWKETSQTDYLLVKFAVKRGTIPFFDASAALSYERTGFLYAVQYSEQGVSLFDSNTVFKAEVVYPIAKSLDFAVVVTTAAVRDSAGNTTLNSNGDPLVKPTVSFETRIRF